LRPFEDVDFRDPRVFTGAATEVGIPSIIVEVGGEGRCKEEWCSLKFGVQERYEATSDDRRTPEDYLLDLCK
jgi:hypothetical protein